MAAIARRLVLVALVIGLLGAAGAYGAYYWTTGQFLISTDDAYVQADYTAVAPKVPGYIGAVLVSDNQTVAAGQVLARIDDPDYRAALAEAEADIATAEADIADFDARIALQRAVIDQARAALAVDQAGLAYSRQDEARYAALTRSGAATAQVAEKALAALREKDATIARDMAACDAAQKQSAVLAAGRAKAVATAAHYRAVAEEARLNLGYTVLRAPIAGMIGDRTLRVGQYVQAGTPLMAVVPLRAVFVTANFKETQLTRLRPGQPVSLTVDGFPGHAVTGRVDSIAPASGLEFALLPPDNATGNFTKIVQRVPVKIVLDAHDPLIGLLRPGMSVEAVVDTTALKE